MVTMTVNFIIQYKYVFLLFTYLDSKITDLKVHKSYWHKGIIKYYKEIHCLSSRNLEKSVSQAAEI